jgi:hypothetical protein
MVVHKVVFVDFNVWVCDDRKSLLLLFDLLKKLLEASEIIFFKYEVPSLGSIVNVEPNVIYWHLHLIE